MASNSRRLRSVLNLCIGSLFRASESFFAQPEFGQLYPKYLVALHWLLRATVPLMERARVVSLSRYRGSIEHVSFAAYLDQHIREEMGHDEWLLEDLEDLGVQKTQVFSNLPSPTAAFLVGAQYYWIEHCDPIALLGYIAIMEGYPISLATVERLSNQTKLPSSAFRTLRIHASLDQLHRDEFDSFLDTLHLTSPQFTLILRSALATLEATTVLLQRLNLSQGGLVSVPPSD
jgi:Iron-containing redox enzyme